MFSSIHLKSRVENQKVLSASVLLFLILWSVIFPSPLSFFRGMRSWTSQSSKFGAISIGNCLQSGRPLLVGALFPAFLWFPFWAAVANSMFYICHRPEWWMLPVETMLHHHKCCFGWCHESANCHSTSCLLVQSLCLLGLWILVKMAMQWKWHSRKFCASSCFGNSLGRSRFCSTWPCPVRKLMSVKKLFTESGVEELE